MSSSSQNKPVTYSRRLYIFIFFILAFVVSGAGLYIYKERESDIKLVKYNELSAIAHLKADQIINWRKHLIAEGKIYLKNEIFISAIKDAIKLGKITPIVLNRMEIEKEYREFSSIGLMDSHFDFVYRDPGLHFDSKYFPKDIFERNEPYLTSIFPNQDTTSQIIQLIVPMITKGERIGVVIIEQDPAVFIYPLIRSWPTPSKTSETLLFKVFGDSLVYLNKLRHSNKIPFTFKLPVNDPDLPAAMLARGITGIIEGIDYRGVPVLADLRIIPDSDWLLVTKVDKDEIFAQLYEEINAIMLFTFTIVLSLAVGAVLIWKNRSAKIYKKLYESEKQRLDILQQFESFTKEANDIILVVNKEGKIFFANKMAEKIYDYKLPELINMNIKQIRDSEQSPDFNVIFNDAESNNGKRYEAVHIKRDGTKFPVEASVKIIQLNNMKLMQSIVRDISERKAHEEMINNSLMEKVFLMKEIHHRVKNNLQVIASLLRLQTESISDEKVKEVFTDSANRIKAIALVHQKLYTENLEIVRASDYIPELIELIKNTYQDNGIVLNTNISPIRLKIDNAVYLGLMINEIVTNAFKHAFPKNAPGKINVSFIVDPTGGKAQLLIEDNGIGFIKDESKSGLGLLLIDTLTDQLDAEFELQNSNGTSYKFTFKNLNDEMFI